MNKLLSSGGVQTGTYTLSYYSNFISHCIISVTSQGERVPQSMNILYSRVKIKGDMSNFMKCYENFSN